MATKLKAGDKPPTSAVACPAANCEGEAGQPCREWTGATTWRPRRILHRERLTAARRQHKLVIPCDVSGCRNPARWYYPKPTLFGWNLCDTCKDTDPRGAECLLIGDGAGGVPQEKTMTTKRSKYFPLLAPSKRCNHCRGNCACPPATLLGVNERRGCAGGTCTCPPEVALATARERSKPAGSSPALRIACPACSAPAGSYCTKFRVDQGPDGSRRPIQVIAHKKRREEEERTR